MENIEYIEQCRQSPIQKELIEKLKSRKLEEGTKFYYSGDVYLHNSAYDKKFIRHEEGMRIFYFGSEFHRDGEIVYLEKSHDWEIREKQLWCVVLRQEDWQEILFRHKGRASNTFLDSHAEELGDFWSDLEFSKYPEIDWVTCWCLFVHKEVWNLTWSWEEKKWLKG